MRKEYLMRGNDINNNTEALFPVVKDFVSNQIKEYKITALLEKLTVDFEEHFKDKLLSADSGSFDTCYMKHFQSKSKSKEELECNVAQDKELK